MRLLESGPRRHRAPTEAAISLAVHTVLIAAFVYATAKGSDVFMPRDNTIENITFTVPRAPAPAPAAAPRPVPQPRPAKTPSTAPPVPIEEPSASAYSGDATAAAGAATGAGTRDAYYDYEVGTAAGMVGGLRPRYPETLRQSGVEGRVEIEFVVDERGRVDMSTLKVIESTHALFTSAVRNALGGMRFTPARVNGVAVRQYVRLPVIFRIER